MEAVKKQVLKLVLTTCLNSTVGRHVSDLEANKKRLIVFHLGIADSLG